MEKEIINIGLALLNLVLWIPIIRDTNKNWLRYVGKFTLFFLVPLMLITSIIGLLI